MDRSIDSAIIGLKQKLLEMANHVEQAVNAASVALIEKNNQKLEQVYRSEDAVNKAHKDIDEACMIMIATQSPIASDLRWILAIIKINTDLERMADQACNIAFHVEELIKLPPVKPLVDLPKMAEEVRFMVRESLDAFVKRDLKLAEDVLGRDDAVDEKKDAILKEMKELMRQNPELVDAGFEMILVARNLERIADHATNIAEDVIFAVSGKDIRHGGE